MIALTELPINAYFDQLFTSKSRNGNYVELFNRVLSMNDQDPTQYGKYIFVKNDDAMQGITNYYLFDIDSNTGVKSTDENQLRQLINKRKNYVATNFPNVPVRNDNKSYINLGQTNQEIINELEILCQPQ